MKKRIKKIFFVAVVGVICSIASNGKMIQKNEIVINEVCSGNFSVYSDENGEYRDYIELYNKSSSPIDLRGYALSDNKNELRKYVFESSQVLEGNALFLLTIPQKDSDTTSFGIREGEVVFLSDPEGKIVDVVSIPELKYNTVYAREEDGGSKWIVASATPAVTNEGAEKILQERLPNPQFSAESGFYEEDFLLEISTKKGTVFYTLDGSEPTRDSYRYERPIIVQNVSENANVYSAYKEISSAFYYKEGRFSIPAQKVDKAVVIKAKVFYENEVSKTVSKVYFVGYQKDSNYSNMPVISIVCKPEDLFGYEKGICVLGKTYEDEITQMEETSWEWIPANYRERGREWEREADITFFGSTHELFLEKKCGIRIKGNTCRALPQKAFNIYSRKIYDGMNEFQVPLFGNTGKKNVTLFCGGQDNVAKLKDALVQMAAQNCDFSTMKYYPCCVFLNGEYWGVYYLMEKYDENYISENYGIEKENIIMIKDKRLEVGSTEDKAYYEEFLRFIEDEDFRNPEVYHKFCDMVDIQSLIDYYAVQIYIARCTDWPGLNEGMWRTRTRGDEPYADTRWRWMLYDSNTDAMDSSQADDNTITYVKETSIMFDKLTQNEEFCRQFVDSFLTISDTVFNEAYINGVIDYYIEEMAEPMGNFYSRYYEGIYSKEKFKERAEDLREFFEIRKECVPYFLREEFGEYM